MRIVKLKGGLGNQMFQYSYALLLKKRTGDKVYVDYSAYKSLEGDTVRVPRIAKFRISLPAATEKELQQVCRLKHVGNSQSFIYRVGVFIEGMINKRYYIEPNRAFIHPETIINNAYFDGYWQSWRYVNEVKDDVLKEFVPNYVMNNATIETQNVMQNQNAVFVGVRRGDYKKEASHYGSFGTEYYERAMSYIDKRAEKPVYYVFSNDIDWCKNNIKWGNRNVVFREKEMQINDFEELMLMATCKHAIIANSSFHWWGATLIKNKNKIICCPKKWWFDDKPIDIIPNDWVKIEA